MELETLFGLPAHPLLVHLPVVIIPLAGLIAIVFAFRTTWLDRFGWGLVGLTGLGALGGILAAGSGEGLEEMQREAESAAREDHFEMGEIARNLGILFFLIVLGVVLVRHLAGKRAATSGFWGFATSKAGALAASALLVLSAAGATATVAIAGHQGAELKWEEEMNEINGGGDGYEDDEGDDDEDGAPLATIDVVAASASSASS